MKISYIVVLYLLQLLLPLRYVIIQMHHVILWFVNLVEGICKGYPN